MKSKRRFIIVILAVLALAVSAIGYALATMPLKYYDEQGVRIASYLKSKDIEAYYSEHRYLSITGWQKGTDISVYGLTASGQFPEIIKSIESQNPETNIWIYFYSGTHDYQRKLIGSDKISK